MKGQTHEHTHGYAYKPLNKGRILIFILLILALIFCISKIVYASDETYLELGKLPLSGIDSITQTTGACFLTKANVNVTMIYVNTSSSFTGNHSYITIGATNVTAWKHSYNSSGYLFYFNVNFTGATQNYCIKFDKLGASYQRAYNVSSTYPVQKSTLNWTSGIYNDNPDPNTFGLIYSMYLENMTKSVTQHITFINQSPSDITSTNAIGTDTVIYYNYTGFNNSNAKLEYGHIGMNEYINGTLQPTYSNHSYSSNDGNITKFVLDDNDIYGYTSNYDAEIMSNTPHGFITLNAVNDVAKIEILNISNTQTYNIMEIMLNTTNNVNVFYCNSSYSNGNPSVNSNCVVVQSGTFIGFNHTTNQSKHNVFSMPIISRNIGNVNVTSTSYIIIKPLVAQTSQIGYINGSVRNNMYQLSSNGGVSFTTDNTKIPDIHIHQYLGTGTGNENLTYRATDSQNNYSTYQTDNIGLTLIPPTSPYVNSISDKTYNDTINVTWTSSSAMSGARITSYTINIVNSSFDVVINGGVNTTGFNSKLFNTTSLKHGYYYAKVSAVDNNSLTSIGYSDSFLVSSLLYSPCNNSIIGNSTGTIVYFNWTSTTPLIVTDYLKFYYLNISNSFNISVHGNNTLTNLHNGMYYIYFNQTYNDSTQEQYNTECNMNVCVNTWTRQTLPCVDNLRLINYTYSCSTPYDYPSDYGTYEDCQLPPNTDKELWILLIIIMLYIVLLIMTIIFPLASIGLLIVSIFATITFLGYMTTAPVIIGLLFPIVAVITGGFSIILRGKN